MKLSHIIKKRPFLLARKYNTPVQFFKENLEQLPNLELNPIFQRGRVWSVEQQIAFVEKLLQHPQSVDRSIHFNDLRVFARVNPTAENSMVANKIVCLDGLQRLTALSDFMDGKFAIFGDITWQKLQEAEDFLNIMGDCDLEFHFYSFETNEEVINFYVDFNSKGVPHSAQEIERVKMLLEH